MRVDSLAEALAASRGCTVILRTDDTPIDDDVPAPPVWGVGDHHRHAHCVGDDAPREILRAGDYLPPHWPPRLLGRAYCRHRPQSATSASHIRVVEGLSGAPCAPTIDAYRAGVHALAAAMFEADPATSRPETTKDGDNPILLVRGLLNGVEFWDRGGIFARHTAPGPSDHLPFGMSPA